MLTLTAPNSTHKSQWQAYLTELQSLNEPIIPASGGGNIQDYDAFLSKTAQYRRQPEDPRLVPSSLFFLMDGKRLVGMVDIRHQLNDALLAFGGHIGYGIRPSERGKGYGNTILALALEECKKLGIDPVLVTCKKTNIRSASIIQANGGVLENEISHDGELQQRYWIELGL